MARLTEFHHQHCRRATTRDLGKKVRQNFSLTFSQLPSMLPTEEEYHFFAPPVNENGKSFPLRVC
jgi:hypothetical protein